MFPMKRLYRPWQFCLICGDTHDRHRDGSNNCSSNTEVAFNLIYDRAKAIRDEAIRKDLEHIENTRQRRRYSEAGTAAEASAASTAAPSVAKQHEDRPIWHPPPEPKKKSRKK